jgi:UDP-N-acetylglucosamine acyltransferase
VNRIHTSAFIGPGVEFGDGNVVGPQAVILGPTFIGDDNYIAPAAVIGAPGEMYGAHHPVAWEGELVGSGIHIGDRNVIREQVSIQAPSEGQTCIGNDCYMMAKSHLPHDGVLEDGVVVACAVLIGGHGRIGAGSNLGLGAVLHQRLVVGPGAMVGMGSVVTKPVPPFAMAFGSPASVKGVNVVGMQRKGLADDLIDALAAAYAEDPTADAVEVPLPLQSDFEWYRARTN